MGCCDTNNIITIKENKKPKERKDSNNEKEKYIKQKMLKNQTNPIPHESMKYIIKQMETCMCKINFNNGSGTGFFCLIPFPDLENTLPVLITNNHVLEEKDIEEGKKIQFTLKNDKYSYSIFINNKRKVYTNASPFDVTIIEIKKTDEIIKMCSFLEIDEEIYNTTSYHIYMQKSVYIIHYPNGKIMECSPGTIKNISEDNKYKIDHLCSTEDGSSGSPIINLFNYKVIGVHKGSKKVDANWNFGTLIKGPILEFNNNFKNDNKEKIHVKTFKIINYENIEGIDEITIKYKKNKTKLLSDKELKEIEELYGETISENKIFGENFVDTNKDTCTMIINGEERELSAYYDDIINNEIIEIKLKGIKQVEDMNYMFFGCSSLFSLSDISKINIINVKSMRCMFFGCFF